MNFLYLFKSSSNTLCFYFIGSDKSQQRIGKFLNTPVLLSNQQILEDLFKIKHKSLVDVLKSDIDTAFSQEYI